MSACPDEVEPYESDPDAQRDLWKDDGWTNAEIRDREHILDGEYLGPRDDQR